jgi:hypothetical protein
MKNICLLLLSLTLFSCNSNVVLESFSNDFEDKRWLGEDYREIDFTIEKDGNNEVQLHFGHITNAKFQKLMKKY